MVAVAGVMVRERHQVAAIHGNVVTLAEPLMCNVTASHGWDVTLDGLTAGWGVEDVHLIGNWDGDAGFQHHNNWVAEAGWEMIKFEYGLEPVVRRVRISNLTLTSSVNSHGRQTRRPRP